tara:strand:+ start:319 stop:804 length:486 start_codon:yes stop_codon:yes gene_type:complete
MTTYQKQKNINMNDTTKILVRGGAILFGGLILVFVTKKLIVKGKKKREEKRLEKLQEDSQGMGNEQANTESQQAETYNPASDLATFEGYVVDYNAKTYGASVNSLLDKLTNAKLKVLNTAFKKKHKISMWQQLDDEWDVCGTWGMSDCYWASKKRLRSAGL